VEPGFKTQLVTSLCSPGRGHARDITGPREDDGCMRFWEARSRTGQRGPRRRCDNRWCGKRPLSRLCTGSIPVDDGNTAKNVPTPIVMLPSRRLLTSRHLAHIVPTPIVMLPSRRLLTSRHLAPQRRTARVSAVESVVEAIAGAREETYIRSKASVAKRKEVESSASALGTWPRASRASYYEHCAIIV
jgi:hypothetical protein